MATQPETARTAAGRPQLYAALLDYQRRPGKYSLARREPAVLFASIRAILQLAAGKSDDERSAALQPAAAFFVRAALICPGTDHYTLLGVDRSCDAATIKEHYRLMMRLVHPDFSSAAPGALWPGDAATRLNLAYAVLASPEKRSRYDEDLAPATATPRPAQAARNVIVTRPGPAHADPRLLVKRLAAGFGAAGALGVAVLLVASGGDRETLVQGDAPLKATFLPPLLAARMPPPEPTSTLLDAHPVPAARPNEWPVAAAATPRLREPAPSTVEVPAELPVSPASVLATPLPVDGPVVSPPPPATAAPANPNAGVTLAEAQPLLAALLQQVESGRGDRLLALLDRDARNAPAAQAVARQLDLLSDGARTFRLSHVDFRAQPAEGRLYVIGHIRLQPGDSGASVTARNLSLRVEFRSREGAAVMTGLSGLAEN